MVHMTVAGFFAYANTGFVKVMARRAAFIGLALLGACGNLSQPDFDKQDRGAGLDRGDYRDALKPRAPENDGSSAPPPIPQAEISCAHAKPRAACQRPVGDDFRQ